MRRSRTDCGTGPGPGTKSLALTRRRIILCRQVRDHRRPVRPHQEDISMRGIALLATLAVLSLPIAHGEGASPQSPVNWPAWRGPMATGVAPVADPPVRWGEGTNKVWKTALPGLGHSSPIVWGDRVFVTTAVETDIAVAPEKVQAAEKEIPDWQRRGARLPTRVLRFVVMALKRSDGSVLWQQTVCESAPHTSTHADGSWASGSPVTDGERVYAYFGSYGLHCLDMDGKKQWEKRFGLMKTRNSFGEGASPALCGDLVLINWDQEGPSFLAALDKKTGAERWRTNRDEPTSWSTPVVVEHAGRPQIIVNAARRIQGYDPADGRVLWECGGMTTNVVPCPVSAGGTVFCMSGFRGAALLAIRLEAASGDITGKAIAWKRDKDTPYVPSPLLYDNLLYFLKANDAILTCVDAPTGKPHYEAQRLDGLKQIYASPVGAAGRVYLTGRNGVTLVLKRGPSLEVLATNALDDSFTASAALAGRELFLRGYKNLYCIAER